MGGLRIKKTGTFDPKTDDEIDFIINNLKMSKKRKDFIREFIVDYNPSQASLRAGIEEKYGYKLLKDERIVSAISELQGTIEEFDDISPEMLAGRMAIYAKSDLASFYNNGWILKDVSELTMQQRISISSVHRKIDKLGNVEMKITIHDSMKANENLARLHGLYDKPRSDDEDIDRMTEKELEDFIEKHYAT